MGIRVIVRFCKNSFLGDFSSPSQIRSTIMPSLISVSAARRGRGSAGYSENTTIPTRFPANRRRDAGNEGGNSNDEVIDATSLFARLFDFVLILETKQRSSRRSAPHLFGLPVRFSSDLMYGSHPE